VNKIIKYILVELVVLVILSVAWFKSISTQATSNNLIQNPSVESVNSSNSNLPDQWYKDFYGNNNRVFTYPVPGQDGNKAVKVEIKKYGSGDAKWAFNDVPVNGNQKYEFSDYYSSNTTSYLIVRFLMKSGAYRYVDVATVNPSNSWTQEKVDIVAPKNAVSMTMYHLIKSVGWLTTDNYSLSSVSNIFPTPTIIVISDPGNTPTPSPTDTPTTNPTPTTTNTPTDVPTNTPTPTSEPTTAPTNIPTDTPAPTSAPTDTPTVTPNPSPTDTPAPTTQPTVQPTVVPTDTPIPTDTTTPSPSPATIPTDTPTLTPTPTQGPVNNLGLISNGDFESANSSNSNLPTNWLQGNWGTNTATFTYPVAGDNSQRAVKVDVTALTDGDAKWYFNEINVTPNTVYTYSDNYISNITTRIVAQFKLTDGTYAYQEMGTANSATNWQSVSQNVTTPANAVSMTIFHLVDKVGNLTIDNATLTQANTNTGNNALPQGMVSLNFDDGWESTFQNGLPIVNGAGYKSTLYIISGYLGDPLYVTGPEVLAAQSKGNEIGAHTKTHPELPLLTPAQIQDEVAGSRLDLINLGATPVNTFSYPYGEYNDAVIAAVKAAGYQSARTALVQDGGFNDKSTNLDLLKTQSVESTTTIADIENWINTAVQTKTWLILVMHQVDNSGDQYSITPANLQTIVNYLKANNVKVVTNSEGVSYLTQ
jgi:peptidoglycan/xylan/chitin deacetylase (PgdA/CDA1 family)